jgi:hypothetical protein
MPEEEEKKEGEKEVQEEWKVRFKDGTVFAPVTYENLVEWYKSGQIDAETPVARNHLTAEWVVFKQTEGFAVAKAAKEGEKIFCISCGAAWPVGTKFCTDCGTNLETGEKIVGAGEKKPDRVIKFRGKSEKPPPQEAAAAPEVEQVVEAPAAEKAVEGEEAPAAEEAAEAVAPAAPAKRGKKKVVKLVVALVIVAVAVKFLAPDLASDVLDKLKSLVGAKKKTVSPEEQREEQRWVGIRDDVRAAVEGVQNRVSSALTTVPFAQTQRGAALTNIADFLKGVADDFTEEDAFISFAAKVADGDLRGAASFLEEEKRLLGADGGSPRIDAIHGTILIVLGKEKEGRALLASAVGEGEVARVAASFCRGAFEGCLERLLPPGGKKDPWASVPAILGVEKEALDDPFLARHSGKVLSAMKAVEALTAQTPEQPLPFAAKGVRTKAFVGMFNRWNLEVQAALVELGKTDPAKRPSVLNQKPARVAYALRLMSREETGEEGQNELLLDVLRAGLSADPENAFYNYALTAVYLEEKKDAEAIREIAAGNAKPAYQDYSKERMLGLVKVLDTPLPYTSAAMKVSCPHFSALFSSSQRLLDSAWSAFRVGRRDQAFEMVGEWRKAVERLREEVCTFQDGRTLVNAVIPLIAAEAEFYGKDGQDAESWEARKTLAANWRLSLAIEYGATYGLTAEVFVKEVFSEETLEQELVASSPKSALAALWAKAAERLDAMLAQDPSRVPLQGVNLQDSAYAAAVRSLNGKKYEAAFSYANACLTRNPRHLWALKVAQQSADTGGAAAEIARPKAVVYRVLGKRDLSLGSLKRLEYEIEVAKDATREQASATARSALQGFWKREKADAVRVYVIREGSPLPYLRLHWAPGGDWAKAKEGTPYESFRESLRVFE